MAKGKGKGRDKAKAPAVICKNRRASRNYELGERMEAGLVLKGSEVKSCREGKAHLNDAYVQIQNGEAYLLKAHIAEYTQAGPYLNHDPERPRKLLLHTSEIHKLAKKIEEKGFAGVPLSLYFKNGRVKLELAVGKGKSVVDKRHTVRERQTERELRRVMRRGGR